MLSIVAPTRLGPEEIGDVERHFGLLELPGQLARYCYGTLERIDSLSRCPGPEFSITGSRIRPGQRTQSIVDIQLDRT